MNVKQKLLGFFREEEGLTTVEYAIAGGLVGAAMDAYSGAGLKYPENVDINNPACE